MINGPVPGEDLEKAIKESRAIIHICNRIEREELLTISRLLMIKINVIAIPGG